MSKVFVEQGISLKELLGDKDINVSAKNPKVTVNLYEAIHNNLLKDLYYDLGNTYDIFQEAIDPLYPQELVDKDEDLFNRFLEEVRKALIDDHAYEITHCHVDAYDGIAVELEVDFTSIYNLFYEKNLKDLV